MKRRLSPTNSGIMSPREASWGISVVPPLPCPWTPSKATIEGECSVAPASISGVWWAWAVGEGASAPEEEAAPVPASIERGASSASVADRSPSTAHPHALPGQELYTRSSTIRSAGASPRQASPRAPPGASSFHPAPCVWLISVSPDFEVRSDPPGGGLPPQLRAVDTSGLHYSKGRNTPKMGT